MSGGEQQMLAMVRGLMMRPTMMMLDEPSLGLSPRLVDEVTYHTVARLTRRAESTVPTDDDGW
jgi:branched-chain amino acid transport system ATP-binding protein